MRRRCSAWLRTPREGRIQHPRGAGVWDRVPMWRGGDARVCFGLWWHPTSTCLPPLAIARLRCSPGVTAK